MIQNKIKQARCECKFEEGAYTADDRVANGGGVREENLVMSQVADVPTAVAEPDLWHRGRVLCDVTHLDAS